MTCCAEPANLQVAVRGSSQIDLSWSPPADGSQPDSYNIYEGTSSGGEVLYDNTTNLSYSVMGLNPDTDYWFYVTAITSGSETSPSNEVSGETQFDPPTNLSASAPNSSEIDLTWNGPGDSYNVYMGTSSGGETYYDNTTGTSYAMTGLAAGTTYYFFVSAIDTGDSESGWTQEISQSTPPANPCSSPSPPANLTLSLVSGSQVDLSWNPPATGSTPASYNMYQGTSSGGESYYDNTTGTGYTMTGLVPGTTNYFAVTTVDGCGNESQPVETSIFVPPVPSNQQQGHQGQQGRQGPSGRQGPPGQRGSPGWQQPPPGRGYFGPQGGPRHIGSSQKAGTPLRLIVTAVRGSQVDLSWTRPGGHSLVAGYNVYGGIRSGRENLATPVNPVMVTQTAYTVTGLTPGTTYYFRVTTVDTSGHESHSSNQARATTTVAIVAHRPSAARNAGPPLLTLVVGPVGLLALGIAGSLLLMRLRSRRSATRGRAAAPGMDVRAVPDPGPPTTVSLRTTGNGSPAGPRSVRVVPRLGISSVTIERAMPR